MVLVSVGDSYLFHSPMFHQVLSGLQAVYCVRLDVPSQLLFIVHAIFVQDSWMSQCTGQHVLLVAKTDTRTYQLPLLKTNIQFKY